METDPSQPLKLFYCYARRDRILRHELDIHLASLRNSGLITTWYDGEIAPGTHWEQEIETHLEAAHVILLLVSPDFIASESCYSKEMKRAIERHNREEARVIPILLRSADWTGTPFSKLQMLPSDSLPVTSWPNRDEAFHDVAKGIRRAVNDLHLPYGKVDCDKPALGRDLSGAWVATLASFIQKHPSRREFSLLMGGALALIIIILLLSSSVPQVIDRVRFQPTPTANVPLRPTPTANVPLTIGQDGIGVKLVDGEYIGISDGRYALDINRDAGSFMLEASESLRNDSLGNAFAEWGAAHEKDTNDAEPLIYEEDQRVVISGSPYITVVLGVSLGVNVPDGFSRERLQGAYIAQKECNDNPQLFGGKKLRLLIARSGSNPDRSRDIAKQIVQAAQFDKTIVGVQGWTNSLTTLDVVQILASAHLPIVSSNNTSDELTGISPYFFSLVLPNIIQIPLITTYIEKRVSPQRLVILRDHTEPYSRSLSDDFAQRFAKDGYQVASTEEFTTGKDAQDGQLAQHVRNILATYKPDFLFFPTNTVGDVTTVLNTIPATAEYADLKVFAGGAGYELVQTGEKINGYARMLLTTSAFPDEWSILGSGNQDPPFFNNYRLTYDPYNRHPGVYTYSRANSEVMLTYDAVDAFLVGSRSAIQQGKQSPTSEDIKNALSQINSSQPLQGVSGAVSFGSEGDPINKLHFILRVADGQHLHVAAYQGCLLVIPECDNKVNILE